MSERVDYLVHTDRSTSPDDLAAVCDAVYDAVADRTDIAFVDAYSDHDSQMPADLKTAQTWLRAVGSKQHHRDHEYGRYSRKDPGIGIKIRPSDEIGWAFVRAYTPWSIAVELFDPERHSIASFDDCGMSVVVLLTPEEAAGLGAALPDGRHIEPLLEFYERKKASKRADRNARWSRRLSRRA